MIRCEMGPMKAPDVFDWRAEGIETSVRNQKLCGNCFMYATTGVFELGYTVQQYRSTGSNEPNEFSVEAVARCHEDSCYGGKASDIFIKYVTQGAVPQGYDDYSSVSFAFTSTCVRL